MDSDQDHDQNYLRGGAIEQDPYRGIEDIRNELPSQTVGRRRGEYIDRMLSDNNFFQQTMARRRKSRKSVAAMQSSQDNSALAVDDFERIQSGEIRDLPFSMDFKRRLRAKYKLDINSKNVLTGESNAKKSFYSKFGLAKGFFTIWSSHLKEVEGNFGTGVATYFRFLRSLFYLSIPSFILSFAFISVPQLIVKPLTNNTVEFTGIELLTGANWLNETVMYYGYYTNQIISAKSDGLYYNMPLAYLLATFAYFLFCLIWVIRETDSTFRKSFVDSTLDSRNFTNKVFCTWNYNVVSHEAADLLHKSIYFDLKEVLAEKRKPASPSSRNDRCRIVFIRIVVWLGWLLITGGSMVFAYYLNKSLISDITTDNTDPSLELMLMPLFVSTVNLIMPYVITYMTHLEEYANPRVEVYVAMFRTFFLKIGILSMLCWYWTGESQRDCWETFLGQEVYRLVVVDFLFSILFSTFCMEFLRRLVADHSKSVKRPNFSIAINVLDLIYGQTLCWLGIFFSPILSMIVIIKYVILFYIKKHSAMNNCRPSKRRWRALQTQTFFNVLLLLSFILTFAFVAYVIFNVKPSTTCGPFRGLDTSFSYLAVWVDTSHDSAVWISSVIALFLNVWVLWGLVTMLLIRLIFLRSESVARRNLSEKLREQIALQGKDKALLLNWLRKISDNPHMENSVAEAENSNEPPSNHRAPVLERHRDSVHSRMSVGSRPHGGDGDGIQMTHVDPHHALINASNSPSAASAAAYRRKPLHADPMLRHARANQARPTSYLGAVPPNHDTHDENFSMESRAYSQSPSPHRRPHGHHRSRQQVESLSPLEIALASKRESQQAAEAERRNTTGEWYVPEDDGGRRDDSYGF